MEWDLAAASPAELAELGAWIAFHKEQRELLLGGELIRMDGYDDRTLVHGIVAPDRSRGLFAMVALHSRFPDPGDRLRLRGLDPARTYRLRPVLIGDPPAGLVPPAWWGPDRSGDVFSGAALERVGVACPRVFPDQAVLYRADAHT